jgi:hypothetical protein
MTFDEYEQKYETIYSEFAAVVRSILEKAIAATDGVPLPQSIQCRAKAASHLKLKLEVRGLAESNNIEHKARRQPCSDPASPNPPALQQTDASKAIAILACLFCARRSRAGERNRPRRIYVRNWNSISGAKDRSVSAEHRITGGSSVSPSEDRKQPRGARGDHLPA